MAKTWRRAIKKYGSLGAISFEKAFRMPMMGEVLRYHCNRNNRKHLFIGSWRRGTRHTAIVGGRGDLHMALPSWIVDLLNLAR
jgi:hypothetical protein